ncbi:MAG: electron transporter [Symploca sp. SIO2E6]|nr:electron transporter [Symploca sp. SIO2E6]
MFAPIVITASHLIGKKEFNQLRGKVIGLHCKTITNFCNAFGISSKERQKLIKLAKSNGKMLGFLA